MGRKILISFVFLFALGALASCGDAELEALQLAAEEGNAEAQTYLGADYFTGKGVKKIFLMLVNGGTKQRVKTMRQKQF